MADGLQVGFLDQLASQSVLHLRGVLAEHRQRLAEAQSLIDGLIAQALAGEDNVATPCLDGRYTLPIDVFGAEIADAITRPLVEMIAAGRPFTKSIYGGVFVSYPGLTRVADFHWHSDGHFDGLDRFGINCWIPLRDCDEQTPRIAFVRATETQLADLSRLPQQGGDRSGHTSVNWPAVSDTHIEDAFGPIETPTFELGDVLVFTNAQLHRTHFPTDAKVGRAALIVRYTLDHAQTSP